MAKAKLGGVIVGLSGTIGGLTVSRNGAGAHVKSWCRGSNPRSGRQMDQRGTFSQGSGYWRALTDLQRDAWNVWAALPYQVQYDTFGDPFYLSGFQWFVRVTACLATVGRDMREDPPVSTLPAAPVIVSFAPATGWVAQSTIEWAPGTYGAGLDLVLFVSVANSLGATAAPSNGRLVAAEQEPAGVTLDFQAGLSESFGSLSVNQRAFCALYVQTDDGLRSAAGTSSAQLLE